MLILFLDAFKPSHGIKSMSGFFYAYIVNEDNLNLVNVIYLDTRV